MCACACACVRVCDVRVCARLVCARARVHMRACAQFVCVCVCVRACECACVFEYRPRWSTCANAWPQRRRCAELSTALPLCAPVPTFLCEVTHICTWMNAHAAQHNRWKALAPLSPTAYVTPAHICAGTGLTPATSAPGLGMRPCLQAQAHMRRSLLADVEVPLSSPAQPEGVYSSTQPPTAPKHAALAPARWAISCPQSTAATLFLLPPFSCECLQPSALHCTALHCMR